ncbi:MAG: type II/IV secretion system protein, partial [Denitromonas sp.]
MNAPQIQPFSPDELAAARATGGRMVDALAAIESEAALRLARLARTFALPLMGHAELMVLAPDFAVMPFEQALRRECIALREAGGALLRGLADPFDRALVAGLGARLAEPFAVALADHDDIAACLARHEDEVRRAAGLSETRGGATGNGGAEDLSLKRISEDASPVVK